LTVLLIAIAGAAGATARYGIGVAVGARSFPWSTLAINLVGSFLLGLLAKESIERGWSDTRTLPLTVGFLGAFTTFSTFSVETHTMLRDGRTFDAAAYLGLSVVGGLLAAAAGYAVAATSRG
jgi:CrcB protein